MFSPMSASSSPNRMQERLNFPVKSNIKYEEDYSQSSYEFNNGSNIVVAFRDLQGKIKHVELDRSSAFRERDRLQVELDELKRLLFSIKNKSEVYQSKITLDKKNEIDGIKIEINDIKTRINYLKDSVFVGQQSIDTKYQMHNELDNEIEVIKSKLTESQRIVEKYRNEIKIIEDKCHQIQDSLDIVPDSGKTEKERLEFMLDELEKELRDQKKGSEKASLRADALQNYVSLILQLNGDLCETVSARESARSKIEKLSAQFLSSPSHSWSQGISQVKSESFVSKSNNSITRENKIKKKKIIKKKRSYPAPVPIRHTFTSYQNQLIQSASRKSATSAATAALAAANVVAGAIGETPQKAFIPSSKAQGAKEFNVVATVSKASREANRLNATLASKVKSLSSNEKELFHDVRRIGLNEMLEHISAIKNLNSSYYSHKS